MKNRFFALLALLWIVLSLGLTACTKDKGPVDPDDHNGQVSFNQVQAIFDQNCTSCHPSSGNLDLRQGHSYDNLVNVPASGYSGTRVVPGNAGQSVLYKKIDGSGAYGSNMPLGGQLSSDQIRLIRDWIDQGASNH